MYEPIFTCACNIQATDGISVHVDDGRVVIIIREDDRDSEVHLSVADATGLWLALNRAIQQVVEG